MEQVLQEYPRPMMVRKSYKNLNGYWDYAIKTTRTMPRQFEGKILVPFSPEAPLSGVERQLQPREYLFYQRTVTVEEDFWKGRLLLHFGAVDQRCEVYVNGLLAGGHIGGYLPFTVDITDQAKVGRNKIQVLVQDVSDTSYHSRGKQKLDRGGMFYTAQSGIWQTVWLESVPVSYISDIKTTPCLDRRSVKVKVLAKGRHMGKVKISVFYQGQLHAEGETEPEKAVEIPLPEIHTWSPQEPNLYQLEISMGEDHIFSYFAMRKFSVEKDSRGILRFCLNNRPYFQNGLLDQGYWEGGLYTAPSDEVMVQDITRAKELGFNMLRKHMKVEAARWYYHCDRLGMIVWQDMVNGGSKYHMAFVCALINVMPGLGRKMKDSNYKLLARQDKPGREEYYHELREMIHSLYNYPCICTWVPFNEGWGQFDAAKVTAYVRKMDRTRLIDQASGWFDQGGGDVYSIHNYFRKISIRPQNRAAALTEYGGISYRVPEHGRWESVYGYGICRSAKELAGRYVKLMEETAAQIPQGLSAAIYTQLADVEEEVNGLFTYDRKKLKIDKETIKKCNEKIYRQFLTSAGKTPIL